MKTLDFHSNPKEVLCIGAHCDDIEIGCGGSLLRLIEATQGLRITWFVLTGSDERQEETRRSSGRIAENDATIDLKLQGFRDGYLPYSGADVKDAFEALKGEVNPDLIFTHWQGDGHQDHRLISELTFNTFRNHAILEYEIPKYDGDLGSPNVFVALSDGHVRKKCDILIESYRSQRGKPWFEPETFMSLLRLRGMECAAPSRYAEAFYSRKLTLLDCP